MKKDTLCLREILLTDGDGAVIPVTLFNEMVDLIWDGEMGNVIGIHGIEISSYKGGKNLALSLFMSFLIK